MSVERAPNEGLIVADLYAQQHEPLLRYAMSLARERSRAEDLVQEAFVRALSHIAVLARLNGYQRQAWLFRVVRNRFFDEQRAAQRQQRLLGRLAREVGRRQEPPTALDARLFLLLESVPERYRELLERRYSLGMTSAEIGRDLGVPPGTIRSRLRLAMEWIRSRHPDAIDGRQA